MEPKLPTPNLGPEQAPGDYGQHQEQGPSPLNPETGFERGVEQVEQRSEATPTAVHAAPVLPSPVMFPAPSLPVDGAQATVIGDTSNPSVAGDDDVIEKEWVDKAKKIINETRDDPHRREQEVAKLQVDYLRKRYGKELGTVDV